MRRSLGLTGAGMAHPWSSRHRYMKCHLKRRFIDVHLNPYSVNFSKTFLEPATDK
jgi:hypothetical protein